MAKFPVDLSKFKKIASDDKTTTLQHPAGHSIKIVHSKLSPKLQEQIKGLPEHKADGGEVGDQQDQPKAPVVVNVGTPAAPQAPEVAAPQEQSFPVEMPNPPVTPDSSQQPMKPGEYKPDLAPGADMYKWALDNPDKAPLPLQTEALKRMSAENQAQQMAHEKATTGAAQELKQNIDEYNKAAAANGLPTKPYPAQVAQLAAQEQQKAQAKAARDVPPPAIQPQAAQPSMMDAYAKNMQGGYGMQMKAIGEKQAADTALGQQKAELLGKQIDQAQKQIDSSRLVNEAAQTEMKNLAADIRNGHINPNHYLENRDSGTKVMQSLGLILGGIGAGMTHTSNDALSFIQSQIDRDIAAQNKNIDNKNNLLGHYQTMFRDNNVAQQMTRAAYNEMYSHMIDQAAAANAGPQAKAIADQLKGQLMQQNAMIMSQVGAGTSGSPEQMLQMLRITNPERAKEMESRLVPGVGFSQVPITAEVRDQITAKQNLDKMAKDLYAWSTKHSGSLDPKVANEGKAKAAELQSMYRNAIKGGVFKAGEQEFIDQIIDSDPAKFFSNIRVLPKLKEVINNNGAQLNTLLKSYGFPTQSAPQASTIKFKPTPLK